MRWIYESYWIKIQKWSTFEIIFAEKPKPIVFLNRDELSNTHYSFLVVDSSCCASCFELLDIQFCCGNAVAQAAICIVGKWANCGFRSRVPVCPDCPRVTLVFLLQNWRHLKKRTNSLQWRKVQCLELLFYISPLFRSVYYARILVKRCTCIYAFETY